MRIGTLTSLNNVFHWPELPRKMTPVFDPHMNTLTNDILQNQKNVDFHFQSGWLLCLLQTYWKTGTHIAYWITLCALSHLLHICHCLVCVCLHKNFVWSGLVRSCGCLPLFQHSFLLNVKWILTALHQIDALMQLTHFALVWAKLSKSMGNICDTEKTIHSWINRIVSLARLSFIFFTHWFNSPFFSAKGLTNIRSFPIILSGFSNFYHSMMVPKRIVQIDCKRLRHISIRYADEIQCNSTMNINGS